MATLHEDACIEEPNVGYKTGNLPPYHLFTTFGEHFVYSLATGQFFHIDAVAFELLEIALTTPLARATELLIRAETKPLTDIETATEEIRLLVDSGVLVTPTYPIGDNGRERQLEQESLIPLKKLELTLADTCNLACTYCYCATSRDAPKKGLMSKQTARRAIDYLFRSHAAAQRIGITFFGGEPLLNPSVFEFAVEYGHGLAERHGKQIQFALTTNATLLDEISIGYIKHHNFGLLVSLDGPPNIHNAQRPMQTGGGSFDSAFAGIKSLMQRRRCVSVRCTITRRSPPISELILFFERAGFTRIVLSPAQNPHNPTDDDLDDALLDDFERQQEELLPTLFIPMESGTIPAYFPYGRFIQSLGKPGASLRFGPRCGACRGLTCVGPDGTLYPCHRFLGMSAFVIGDLGSGPLPERRKQFWLEYQKILDSACSTCWAQFVCKGPCPWLVARPNGQFLKPTASSCRRSRAFFERAAWVAWRMQTTYPSAYHRLTAASKYP